MRTRVKICGMTDRDEALAIAALGADALGFIFAKASPRCVSPERVREIVAALPPFVDLVGVFMDQEAAEVNDIARSCGLTTIQLHGDETPEYCRLMTRPVVKVFRVGGEALPDLEPYRHGVKGVLFDTYRRERAGGTGETFDWGLVARVSLPVPLILAGGLSPANVADAIRQVRPFAVDVNSGVESSPGRKDLDKIGRLFAEVRKADQQLSP